MEAKKHCPNPACARHADAPPRDSRPEGVESSWYVQRGTYETKAFGTVRRFRCKECGKFFSDQTLSIDYYAKKKIDYDALRAFAAGAPSGRAIARAMGLSPGSVTDRIRRMAGLASPRAGMEADLVQPR